MKELARVVFLLAAALPAVLGQLPESHCTPPPRDDGPSLPAKILPGQGRVHFPITTSSEAAQAFFDQGVAQMHSFWTWESERSFRQAAALDPESPMPWFGVAMVAAGDFRPRFQLETYLDAQLPNKQWPARSVAAALKARQLASVPGKATELEKMYIDAVSARRDASLDSPEEAYTEKLRALLRRYPNEVEARAYLALHLMRGYVLPEKTPRSSTMEAVAILRQLINDAPGHPGVHHYVIHGFEGSTFAREAFPSCEKYVELAPNIPHAQHMPGHIYSQTGRWRDAVNAFEAAAANERYWLKEDATGSTGHHGHNVHYLATAYSFLGEYDKAMNAARELLGYQESPKEVSTVDGPRIAYRQGWFAMLRSIVQAERWQDLAQLPVYDRPRQQAWRHWAQGAAAAMKGDAGTARAEMRDFEASVEALKAVIHRVPEELTVAGMELEGHIGIASGATDAGLARLQAAATRERHMIYAEPPLYPRPVSEALGRVALRLGRPDTAERAFRTALEQYEESVPARRGLDEALKRQSKAPVTSAAR